MATLFTRSWFQKQIAQRRSISRRRASHSRPRLQTLEHRLTPALAAWVAQGPGPTTGAQLTVNPNDDINGAIQAIAPQPGNSNILYAGTVNGGVWKTSNATAVAPTWTPLTDNMQSQSIGDIEFDLSDGTSNTLIVGTGRLSNFAQRGDDEIGLYYTTNGGTTFSLISDPLLDGQKFIAVGARGSTLLAGSTSAGLFRSTNTGSTWANISGINGLTAGGIDDIVGDPTNLNRFYVSVHQVGVFRTTNAGATWTDVTAGLAGVAGSPYIRLAVNASAGVLYAAVSGSGAGAATQVFRSTNQGGTWTALDTVSVHPGGQQFPNTSLAADPTNVNLAYIGGDQITGSRVDASKAAGTQWTSITGANASATTPHADTRHMTFMANGTLLQASDGGVYGLSTPTVVGGSWRSVGGNMQAMEVHDVAWNSINNTLVVGTQDNGTQQQLTTGALSWDHFAGGDGGDVAVDSVSLAGVNQAIRYFSSQNLGSFRRQVVDINNIPVGAAVNLAGITGAQFVTPVEINTINPNRILIGGSADLFESMNQGTTNTNIGGAGANRNAMVYGGFLAGVPNEELIYVGASNQVFKRTVAAGAITATTALPAGAGTITDVAIDPNNYDTVFAVDSNQVFFSSDGGTTWSDITGDLATVSPGLDFRTITYVTGAGPYASYIAIGTRSGVFMSQVGSFGTWTELGAALPDVLVFDLIYNAADNILLAGTLGRSVWSLSNASTQGEAFSTVVTTPADVSIGDGLISLREAVFFANTKVGANTISFDAMVFATAQTITLTSGELAITESVTVNGPGADKLTVTAAGKSRDFNLTSTGTATITLSGMTITGASVAGNGGGVFGSDENVTLSGVALRGNIATTGGGVAMANNGVLTLISSELSGNSVTNNGGGFYTNSTATVIVRNCTISGNTGNFGGGFCATSWTVGSSFTMQNSTVTANSATAQGGGLRAFASGAALNLESSVVSGNTGPASSPQIYAGTVNLTRCLVGSLTGFTLGTNVSNVAPGTPEKLGPLGFNGGPTQTHLPASDSPLLKVGSNPAALATDQRGAGYPRSVNTFTDIGAINGVAPTSLVVRNTNDAGIDSLRQAVIDSNGLVGTQAITFDPAVFAVPQTITLTTGEMVVTDNVTITGPTAQCTVSGNNASRIFNGNNVADPSITISGLRLTAGKAPAQGGAILASGNVTVQNCTITGNSATFGGGIGAFTGGLLTITDSVISNNTVSGSSGGFFAGAAVIQRTTISGNTAVNAAGGYVLGSLSMVQSTVSGNTASGVGGGLEIESYFASDVFLIQNCTFSGNTAASSGGGIALGQFGSFAGTLRVQNSTFTNNTANGGSGGGGIARIAGAGLITLDSTIVSGNAAAGANKDLFTTGTVVANFSAVGIKTGVTTFTADATTNALLGAALSLGALADNGGPTQTHLPAANSPVINKGSNVAGLANDQRGAPAARSSNGGVDIGAVERQVYIVINTNDAGVGSLRQAVLDANALTPSDDLVVFDTAGVFATAQVITLATGEMAVSDSVTINAPPAGLTISGNNASRIFNLTGAVVNLSGMTLASGNALNGGAILMTNSSLSMSVCTLSGNTSTSAGGAVRVQTSIAGNTLDIDNCTLSSNKATNSGGAVLITGPINVNIRNSTISGNTSNLNGGAIRAYGAFSGTLTVLNSTITQNVLVGTGGGRGISLGGGTANITSTIVAQNSGGSATTADLAGTFNVNFSLIGTTDGAVIVGANNLTGTNAAPLDAMLSPLANNGGPTLTHAPLAASPVLNKGSNPGAFTFDQRGAGFPRAINAVADIGAIEFIPSTCVVRNVNDSGADSLRQCVIDANSLAGTQTVTFDPVVFAGATGITLTTGEIVVSDSVTILGPTATCTVSGNAASRIFNSTFSSGLLSISNLSFAKGSAAGTGGAINSSGGANLTLAQCSFDGNKSSAGGGSVCVIAGVLTATDCSFSLNSGTFGGAIDVFGSGAGAVLTRCTISGNTGTFGGGAYIGGSLLLDSCTISGNTDTGTTGGGGLFLAGSIAMTIRNSTISGNMANIAGGGIVLSGLSANLNVQNSTITNNTSKGGGGGGGIARVAGTATINLDSTIVSGNFDTSGSGRPDMFTTGIVTANVSAIGSPIGITTLVADPTTAALLGKPLSLGALADNGGPTLTHLPGAGSPVINMGSNPAGLVTDQRGGQRVIGGAVDIGSVETSPMFIVTNDLDHGQGSLRQCTIDANITPGLQTITFEPVFFSVARTIGLTTGQMTLAETVTITGPGIAFAVVNANAASRIFQVTAPAGNLITISGLGMTNGKQSANGAGILTGVANVTLNNVFITNCVNTGPGGGVGIPSGGGTITITNSTISGNSANRGGGVYFFTSGALVMTGCTVSGNSASDANGGGGLYNYTSNSTIINSTFSGNTTAGSGGAIQLFNNGTVNVFNSTITGNTAAVAGGGINRASGTLSLNSTIVAGNSNATTPDLHSAGAVNLAGNNNLIGAADGTGFTLTGVNNQTGTVAVPLNAKLGPLANNGGPTMTHALLAGSPAINKGSNLQALTVDQRGQVRVAEGAIDIGAFEVQAPCITKVIINGGDIQRSRVLTIDVVFDILVTLPGVPATAFELKRQSDNKLVDLTTAVTNTTFTTVTFTFNGALSEFTSLQDGRYTLTAFASKISGADGPLDGNCDGVSGDDYQLVGAPGSAPNLFRFFGDISGDGAVAANDFIQFRLALGGTNPIFDFDNDGAVAASDFIQFRLRFGGSI